jgi:outer membrane lipoprotein-sorting protein
VTSEDDARARALLERVIAAKGGLDKLRDIRTIVARQTVTNLTQDGTVDAATTSYIGYPDKFRVETTLPDATLVQVFDGMRLWTRDPQGVRQAPAEAVAEAQRGLQREVVATLVAAADGAVRARLLQDVKGSEGRVQHALELSSPTMNPVVLYVDAATLLIMKQTYSVAGRPGTPLVEETFSDYRPVDGIQIPFAAERRIGAIVVRRQVSDIKINTPIDPALFKRPGA